MYVSGANSSQVNEIIYLQFCSISYSFFCNLQG